jgi:hypothetical protein
MSIKGDIIAVGLAGAVLLAAAWYAKRKIGAAADKVLPLVNPADERNVVNQAAQGFYQTLTGDTNGTIGTGIYDLTHTGGALENVSWWQALNPGAALGGALGNAIGKAPVLNDGTLNPVSDNNIIYRNLGASDGSSSFGTKLYDWLH